MPAVLGGVGGVGLRGGFRGARFGAWVVCDVGVADVARATASSVVAVGTVVSRREVGSCLFDEGKAGVSLIDLVVRWCRGGVACGARRRRLLRCWTRLLATSVVGSALRKMGGGGGWWLREGWWRSSLEASRAEWDREVSYFWPATAGLRSAMRFRHRIDPARCPMEYRLRFSVDHFEFVAQSLQDNFLRSGPVSLWGQSCG